MEFPTLDWWPSGPLGTFLLFLMPVGPAKTLGIHAGTSSGLDAATLLLLYVAKDVVMGSYLEPVFRLLRNTVSQRSWSRALGQQIATLAARFQLGTSPPARFGSLVLISLGGGFLVGAVALHMTAIQRFVGWGAVILGDVLWFCVLLMAALGLSKIVPDQRLVFVGVCALAFFGDPIARQLRALAGRGPTPEAVAK